MKQIHIFMIHNAIHSVKEMIAYLKWEGFLNDFNFIWDEKKPDYVISTEHIYFTDNCKRQFKNLFQKDCVHIEVLSELYMPDFNIFDYSTGFYNSIECEDRYVQFLTPDKFYQSFLSEDARPLSLIESYRALENKMGFCNFLYSNPNAHPNRDLFFHKLSKYKKVDSLGQWLNNVEHKGTGFVGHANECINIKSAYKFSIAIENASCKGYSTEKILTSLQAHTIPIYWGDPDLTKLINPNCFINCHDYKSFDEVIEVIKEIDNDDNKWCEMISQPWFTEKNLDYKKERNQKYYDFWRNIFTQEKNIAKRVAIGYHPDNYLKWFSSATPIFHKGFVDDVKTVVRKVIK